MWLLTGRKKLPSQGTRSVRSSTYSSSRREVRGDEDEVEVPKPDLEELRERRAEYYRDPVAARKKASSTNTSRSTSKRSTRTTSTASRSVSERQRRHTTRRHKSTTSKAEAPTRKRDTKQAGYVYESERDTRTEDYVYAPRIPGKTDVSPERVERDDRQRERPRSIRKTSKHSSSSRRRSLPTVFEAEVTPDDSISQVGAARASERSVLDEDEDDAEEHEPVAPVRPPMRRSRTTSSKLAPIPEYRSRDFASNSTAKKSSTKKRPTPSKAPSRRHSTTSVPTQPRLVECLTCGSDDIPSTKSAKLSCGHRMCHDCLKRIFQMSVNDPQHMPPKCCKDEHIPLEHVDKLFDVKFKTLWNRKYQEYTTQNRIYCPVLRCGEWIKPSYIHTSQGRKYASCPRCKTKVCTLCNNKLHKSSDCPKDPEIAKLVEQAKEQGWQRCYSCNALVERHEGCNHMTCRCNAQFCILCGLKWKTCECPWFNYTGLPDPDRLQNMRVPEPIRMMYRQVFGGPDDQHFPAPDPPTPAVNNVIRDHRARRATSMGQEPTYQQELEQRRTQERLDADLARRLQLASMFDDIGIPPAAPIPRARQRDRSPPHTELWGVGNAADNFMNDDFVQNAADVVMDAFGDTNLGRRGERASGRRRRAARARVGDDDGLAPGFLGDESVLGVGAARGW